jgi:hypothetical protein
MAGVRPVSPPVHNRCKAVLTRMIEYANIATVEHSEYEIVLYVDEERGDRVLVGVIIYYKIYCLLLLIVDGVLCVSVWCRYL